MKNKKLIIFVIFALSITLSQSVWSQSADDSDDSKIKKYEVGGQITVLHQRSYEDNSQVFNENLSSRLPDNHQTEIGLGGRFTYNFNKNIAVEVEANYFPVNRLAGKEIDRIFGTDEFIRLFVEPKGRKFQAFAGPKIGYRGKKIGVFGKIRPGLFYVDRFPSISFLSLSPAFSTADYQDIKAVFYATDVGGVVEFYPSKRTVLRFDVGDTIIVYKAGIKPKEFNPGFTRHTFQFSTGFGFRF